MENETGLPGSCDASGEKGMADRSGDDAAV